MFEFLKFFRRKNGMMAENLTSLDEVFAMAEAQRHANLAQGVAELSRRKSGGAPDAALESHTVFARIFQKRHEDFERNGSFVSGRSDEFDLQMRIAWCGSFLPDDVLRKIHAIATQRRDLNGMRVIIGISEAFEFSGRPNPFVKVKPMQDPDHLAKQRLRARWDQEAIVVRFQDTEYKSLAAKIAWINQLDAGSLHEFACRFHWDGGEYLTLHAVVAHPACDKATAFSLFGLAAPDYYEGTPGALSDPNNSDICELLDAISARLAKDDFATAAFKPAEDPASWRSFRDKALSQGKSLRWNLPDRAFEGYDNQPHNPEYEFRGDMEEFRIPFEKWSRTAVVGD